MFSDVLSFLEDSYYLARIYHLTSIVKRIFVKASTYTFWKMPIVLATELTNYLHVSDNLT